MDYKKQRDFLKATFTNEALDILSSDENGGVAKPDLQKSYPDDAELIDLISPEDFALAQKPLLEVIKKRKSWRKFIDKVMSLEELSFLLWAVSGVRNNKLPCMRTSPTGGARCPLVTYVFINNVDGLEKGLYRYLPIEHKLLVVNQNKGILDKLMTACLVKNPARPSLASNGFTMIWSTIPYRTEWRYTKAAAKIIALDAGHACQNLYLAAEGVDAGVCAIGAYDQKLMDDCLKLDGVDEFVIYMATVGKIA